MYIYYFQVFSEGSHLIIVLMTILLYLSFIYDIKQILNGNFTYALNVVKVSGNANK